MNNLDLNLKIDRDKKILSSYDYETLLLEISTNIQFIDKGTVLTQGLEQMKRIYEDGIETLQRDLTKITNHAIIDRHDSLIKPEFVLRLHEMDCYDDFMNEVSNFVDLNNIPLRVYVKSLNKETEFQSFIDGAFSLKTVKHRTKQEWIKLYKEFNLF